MPNVVAMPLDCCVAVMPVRPRVRPPRRGPRRRHRALRQRRGLYRARQRRGLRRLRRALRLRPAFAEWIGLGLRVRDAQRRRDRHGGQQQAFHESSGFGTVGMPA